MILLDTHVLFWLALDERTLGRRANGAIDRAQVRGEIAVSAMTFWEAGMLQRRGRMALPAEASAWRVSLLRDGLIEIPVDGAIAVRAGLLPNLHGDPADRVIVATAMEGHTLITADDHLLDWPGDVIRLDARS